MSWTVDVQGKGNTPIEQVCGGDLVRGYSVARSVDVFRRVQSSYTQGRAAGYIVSGQNISPTTGVWNGQTWVAAYKMPGATLDMSVITDFYISVRKDEDDESNLWLVGNEPLLIRL